ncbi:MAG: class I SAM-dependent methyltransferase [Alphaproteobacteria bacterium]
MTGQDAAATANAAMQRYWNEVAGPRWVGRQEAQDARNVEMLEQLLAAAAVRPGERVLDIGCGTGVTTVPYARAVGPSGHVTGADISRPMLDAARRRVDGAGLNNVDLILADAQVHEFAPESYDLLTSRLGVMFFADPAAAFRNLIRALRPGGRLCMAVWATIDENPHWRIPFEIAVRRLGAPAPQPPRAPGPHALGDRDYLRGILHAAGFAAIAIQARPFHVRVATQTAAAEHATQSSLLQHLFDEKRADEAARQAILRDIEAAFTPFAVSEGVRLPATFLLVGAHRAG